MPLKSLKSTAIMLLLIASTTTFPALLPYPSSMPKVSTPTTPYDTILLKTWGGILERNVNAYTTGLVHRPRSDMPGDAVSEGVSYGMFLALYCNDQANFNKIWNAGEKYMWNGGGNFYDWRVNKNGEIGMDRGPASDADQDIALLLVFADELVKNGIWKSYTSDATKVTYSVRAKSLLNTIRTTMVEDGRFLLPGQWGGGYSDTKNPGYFAPAFYRVFAEYDPDNKAAWEALVNGSYELIAKSPGYALGLIPDWCKVDGTSTGGAGYNAYFDGDALYRDAIRVYWRLGVDYLWYKEPRAKVFLDNAIAFLGTPEKANFFDMTGNLLPEEDTEILGSTVLNIKRTRREHSHLTVGMWAAAAMASGGPALAEGYSDELLKFYKAGTNYWGYAVDPAGGTEDTAHNEMYFDQFLAWFGASMLGGVFTNVWEDLKGGVPQGPPGWRARPVLSTRDVNASVEPLRVTASFTRTLRWTATFRHDETGSAVSYSASSDSMDLAWYGLSGTGGFMPQGFYTLTIDAPGLPFPYSGKLWLGQSANLMRDSRLLVDDFADGDVIPYIGTVWTSFLDSDFGVQGASTATVAVNKESGVNWLHWNYKLDQGHLGYDPYAGLDWSCRTVGGDPMDLTGIDTLIIRAKAQSGVIGVSVQLVSSDFGFPGEYQYFSDTISLTAAAQTFALPLSNFKQRADGSGKSFATTLRTVTSIRFQVQAASGTVGTIIVDEMLFAGNVSKLYTAPPPYIARDGEIPPDTDPDRVSHRAGAKPKYSIKRGAGVVRIALPANMSGASAVVVDVRGRVVRRASVAMDGRLDLSMKGLAKGMYFVDVKKAGVSSLRLSIGNVR